NMNMRICDYTGVQGQCGHMSDCTGTGMQNSYQFLIQNVGQNPNQGPDTVPPEISFITPHDGDTVASGFHIEFNATDDRSLASVTLYMDNGQIGGAGNPPYAFDVPPGLIPAGVHKIKGLAKDAAGNQTFSSEISVTVKKLGDTPGDLGSACTV